MTEFNLLAHGDKIIRSFCIVTEDEKLLYNSNGVLWLSARFTGSFSVSMEPVLNDGYIEASLVGAWNPF